MWGEIVRRLIMPKDACWNAVLLCFVVLTGCTAGRVDMVEAGRLRPESSKMGTLARPNVWAQDGELTIHASSTQRGMVNHYPSCVEVFVVAPDGTTLAHQEVRVSDSHAGARASRMHLRSYSVRFPLIPPDGSVVKVRPCSKHVDDATSSRLRNATVADITILASSGWFVRRNHHEMDTEACASGRRQCSCA